MNLSFISTVSGVCARVCVNICQSKLLQRSRSNRSCSLIRCVRQMEFIFPFVSSGPNSSAGSLSQTGIFHKQFAECVSRPRKLLRTAFFFSVYRGNKLGLSALWVIPPHWVVSLDVGLLLDPSRSTGHGLTNLPRLMSLRSHGD